jgi:RNA polymerase sigma factor (sigma-70 family)
MSPPGGKTVLSETFDAHRSYLWGLCYRMTGCAADAEELVQGTFVRALEAPPSDQERSWLPWLTRVATNLARDRLRRRKHHAYTGPWLPEPFETSEVRGAPSTDAPDARYAEKESVGFAFLVALEALDAKQRAVLLLRDVYDLSTRESADILALSEANIKVVLHRARKAMESYDSTRLVFDAEHDARTKMALVRLMTALATGNVDTMATLLHEDVVMLNDGGGEFFAAQKPVRGRKAVTTFFRKTRPKAAVRARPLQFNGMPGVFTAYDPPKPGPPPRAAIALDVDEQGLVVRIYTVVATVKLRRLGSL